MCPRLMAGVSDDDIGEASTMCWSRRSGHPDAYRVKAISYTVYYESVHWDVRLWKDVASWVLEFDDETYHLVAAAIPVGVRVARTWEADRRPD